MLRFSLSSVLGAAAVAATLTTASAQQSGVSLNPFVTFLPTGSASPMAGLAMAITGGPLALRAGGHLSMEEQSATATSALTTRPWGADIDAIAYLETYTYANHTLFTPYVFTGVSTASIDSGAERIQRQGWSYGGGLTAPVAGGFGLFGEARWRMSRYVLPDASNAPPATREFRVGFTFHVGGGGALTNVVHVIPAANDGADGLDGAAELEGSPNSGVGVTRLLSTADRYIGTPYRRGGASPSSGFDASGFVRFVFAQLGVVLPRSTRDQARVGDRVRTDWSTISPGDLLLFEDEGGISHVAIYVGRSRIIHSSASGGGVRYDDLSTDRGRWFFDHLVAARRVTPDARGLLVDLARGFPADDDSDVPDRAPRAPLRRRN